jgi:hypothetical protein
MAGARRDDVRCGALLTAAVKRLTTIRPPEPPLHRLSSHVQLLRYAEFAASALPTTSAGVEVLTPGWRDSASSAPPRDQNAKVSVI